MASPSGNNFGLALNLKNDVRNNYLIHNTNWESNLNSTDFQSKSFLNAISSSSITFLNTDYSYHKFDGLWNGPPSDQLFVGNTYRNVSFNRQSLYTFQSNWEPNELAMLDDIAIVGIKDYCSTRKYVQNLSYAKITQYAYGRIDIPDGLNCSLLASAMNYQSGDLESGYEYFGIQLSINEFSYGTVNVTTYTPMGAPAETLSYTIPAGESSEFEVIEIAVVQSSPDIVDKPFVDIEGYAGFAGYVSYGTSNPEPVVPPVVPPVTPGTNVDLTPAPVVIDDGNANVGIPDTSNGSLAFPTTSIIPTTPQIYDCYFNPRTIYTKWGTSGFFLNARIGGVLNFGTVNEEYTDLSDTFIEVNYTSGDTDSVVESGNERVIYKFAGYKLNSRYLHGNTPTVGQNLIDKENCYYYPVYDIDSEVIIGIVLSSAIDLPLPQNVQEWNFIGDFVAALHTDTSKAKYYPVDTKFPGYTSASRAFHGVEIPISSVNVIKIKNFPRAGKVDIYTRKTGKVLGFSYGKIVSPEHNLQTGDIIKFTGAFNIDEILAIWMEDKGFIYDETEYHYLLLEDFKNNLNNIKYVKVIDSSSFQIFEDKDLTKVIMVPFNVSFKSSLAWSCIGNVYNNDNQAWGHYSTLTSPCGENGHLGVLQKRESHTKPKDYSIKFAAIDQPSIKQLIDYADLDDRPDSITYLGLGVCNSWTNYYPFDRNQKISYNNLDIKNGNKFGCAIDIKKLSDLEYILAIGESGASESFRIVDEFELITGDKSINYNQYCPFNVKVIPKHLPYGRVHFYKITKNTYGGIKSIERLNSISRNDNIGSSIDHPWKAYEASNKTHEFGNDPRYYSTINAILRTRSLEDFIENANTYWNGAAAMHWTKNYLYQIGQGNYPDLINNITYFPYVDEFGKSIGVDLSQNIINFAIGCNIRSSTVPNILYGMVCFGRIALYYSRPLFDDQNLQINYVPTINNEKIEISNLANKIIYKDGKVFFGWTSSVKAQSYLYYYQRNKIPNKIVTPEGDPIYDHSLIQTIQDTLSNDNSNFGRFISYDQDYLITNGVSNKYESTGTSTIPLDYLYIYRYNELYDNFSFYQKLSATIDLSNLKYSPPSVVNRNSYLVTTNTSYDGTTNNSATYIYNLTGKYDTYKNVIVIRDPLEYSVFINNPPSKFKSIFHTFARVDRTPYDKRIIDTKSSVIKIASSAAPATFDTKTVYDMGQFSKSYQIFDYSSYLRKIPVYRSSGELLQSFFTNTDVDDYNISTSLDFQDPNYGLNLFISVPNIQSGTLGLFHRGYAKYNSGVTLFTRSEKTSNSELKMFLENGRQNKLAPLYIRSGNTASGIKLFLENGKHSSPIDLFLKVNIQPSKNNQTLFLKQIIGTKNSLNSTPTGLRLYTFGMGTPKNSNHSLYIQGHIKSSGNTTLYTKARAEIAKDTTLFVRCGENANYPLYISYIIPTTGIEGAQDLFMQNEYPGGIPDDGGEEDIGEPIRRGEPINSSYNLFMQSIPYDDHASRYDLFIGQPLVENEDGEIVPVVPDPVTAQTFDSAIGLNLQTDDYIYIPGTSVSGSYNLFIKCQDVKAEMPLFVYNNIEENNLNLYTRSANISSGQLSLHIFNTPSSIMTLYQRGFIPYA
jgi:hypothetical protein